MVPSTLCSSANGNRREWELLACCARSQPGPGCSDRIADLVRTGVDWDGLIALATRHRLVPLLYWNLFSVCPEAVPPSTLAELQGMFTRNGARNRILTFELLDVLKCFTAHSISAVTFKGPTLARAAYSGLALRQAGDLDILVPVQDAVRARRLLVERGFRPYHRELTEDQEYHRSHHFVMVRDVRPLTVEIHWRLMGERLCFELSDQSIWGNQASTTLAGVNVPCLATRELLIFLCAHGTKHCWHRLSWVCDIAELIRSERSIDWDRVIGQARSIGAQRMLFLGLLLACEVLDAPVDETISRAIRADATTQGLARAVIERYRRQTDEETPDFAQMWRFNLKARERRRDRLRCRFRLMAPALRPNQRDFQFVRLPRRLSFFYHAVKPVRLATKFASNAPGFIRMVGDLVGMG